MDDMKETTEAVETEVATEAMGNTPPAAQEEAPVAETPPAPEEEAAPAPEAEAAPVTEPAPKAPPAQSETTQTTTIDPSVSQAFEGLKGKLKDATVREVATKLGVQPDRVKHVAKMADLDEIDISQDGAAEKIESAMRAVLGEVPELAISKDTGSSEGHRRQGAGETLEAQMAEAMGVKL